MQNQEVKGTLAKLLATENIIVEHRRCETAQFDVDKRILTLPIWDASDRVYNMLVGHEVGHALYTPNEDWSKEYDLPQSYVNVTEDARIEKLMKRKFPGLTKDFYKGYQELNDDDFFQIEDEDISTLNLIDRINLYFKIGSYNIIPFNAPEMALRDATGAAETFLDAIEAARAIYNYEKAKKEEEKLANIGLEDTTEGVNLDQNEGQSTGNSGEDESKEGQPQNKQGNPEESESDEAESNTTTSKQGGDTADLESRTDKALQDAVKDMTKDAGHYEPTYMEVDDVDLKHHVVSPHKVHELNTEFWSHPRYTNPDYESFQGKVLDFSYVDNEYRQWKRLSAREVNYLAKEFEMKKAATAYSRSSIARTGVLDTSKLHQYKFNDDIFKKVTMIPEGKNHGLIFLLDWSGSMADDIHDTYKQLLSLCLFCRKVGIPFDVYSFVGDGSWYPETFNRDSYEEWTGRLGTLHIPENFFLVNLLSSSLNNKLFDTYARDVWRITTMFNTRYGYRYSRCGQSDEEWERRMNIPDAIPSHMQLGGTPLCEAIGCLQSIIPDFKRRNGVEKVHVSILSDGEAAHPGIWMKSNYHGDDRIFRGSVRYQTQIRDRKTGRIHKFDESAPFTKQLLRYLKGKFPECNFLGFRIITQRDLRRILDRECNNYGWDKPELKQRGAAAVEKYISGFRKTKCIAAPILGFQEIYFIASTALNTEVEFDVDVEATKAQIKTAFQKSLKGKKNNKKILSAFIDQIA
tara:strand:+ start:996 stop:3230 length:2235 start_codon:yes stop_codon:yes gene_type:complete